MAGEAPDAEILELVHDMFQNRIAFNQLCGFKIDLLDPAHSRIHFAMDPQLVGNFVRGNLHGGAICSVLDVVGGLVLFVDVAKRMRGRSKDQVLQKFSRMGTIDIRVDFLRPGLGNQFTATGSILRAGRKVAVTRMELHNDEDILIAVATGSYVTS